MKAASSCPNVFPEHALVRLQLVFEENLNLHG
jgi:hypothetical protein